MKKTCSLPPRPISLLVALAFVGWASLARAQPPASGRAGGGQNDAVTARTLALVETFRGCCGGGQATAAPQCAAADPFFAYERLANATLARLADKLKAPAKRRLVRALEEIFRATARQSGGVFCTSKPQVAAVRPVPGGLAVDLRVLEAGEDVATEVAFVWSLLAGRYQVVDLVLEGGSLVADYQNQFSRLFAKEGADGLLRRVEARRAAASMEPSPARPKAAP